MKLERGTVKALYNSQKNNPLFKNPVLQVTSLNKIVTGDSEKHRYTANASDGTYYMKAVFSSGLSPLIDDGRIQRFHVLKLDQFTVRPKENNNYLYIQSLIESEAMEGIVGRPMNIATGRLSMEPAAGVHQAPAENPAVSIKRSRDEPGSAKRGKDAGGAVFTDIKDINPFQTKWMIKGRVTSKSDIRKFTSSRGEGKLFSFELADKTAQVKCVAFSECVDIFFPLVEANKVLTLTNATIKMANKKYSLGGLDYEIQLEKTAEMQQVEDESIPQYSFKFVKIRDLAVGPALIDVAAVIKEVYPVGSVTVKSTGKELAKRDLFLVDETGSCRLTLWGPRAEQEYEPESVLCLKAVKVGEYNGINLSSLGTSQVIVNCDAPEAIEVMAWYQAEGKDIVLEKPKRLAQRQLIGTVKDAEAEYATVQGVIMHIKEDGLYYEACPGEGCSKKVTAEDSGSYRCEKCSYTYSSCNYRYMLTLNVGDFTGQIWASLFDEAGKSLFGMAAQQLKEMGDENPQDLQNLLRGMVSREFTMRLRIKDEIYNGEPKKRFSCLDCVSVDHVSEAKRMLDAIERVRA